MVREAGREGPIQPLDLRTKPLWGGSKEASDTAKQRGGGHSEVTPTEAAGD